ncbi:uncharacterized protein L969DRAFT_43774 [Mixia osmundae IAM 14324]|uniref:Uncharacterized protein n=1 Tax=Mixia osmundae (strain CBS 9802 / IAM 14324 / JCM 22182 / KY 12970) TaxID=764103 RepID=G7E858_MIXOS|nr:uncharacterized protein L969DRAFT_43774 [Mixia osmundae IAM 14324]KEI42390.1 hypothetical protein L969DRAFT_43774 [Mixia osmundae IAM 14324]GAA99018.1 hypothetical protein E5Q_05707 [Mixia osmundae IAM 14324]
MPVPIAVYIIGGAATLGIAALLLKDPVREYIDRKRAEAAYHAAVWHDLQQARQPSSDKQHEDASEVAGQPRGTASGVDWVEAHEMGDLRRRDTQDHATPEEDLLATNEPDRSRSSSPLFRSVTSASRSSAGSLVSEAWPPLQPARTSSSQGSDGISSDGSWLPLDESEVFEVGSNESDTSSRRREFAPGQIDSLHASVIDLGEDTDDESSDSPHASARL